MLQNLNSKTAFSYIPSQFCPLNAAVQLQLLPEVFSTQVPPLPQSSASLPILQVSTQHNVTTEIILLIKTALYNDILQCGWNTTQRKVRNISEWTDKVSFKILHTNTVFVHSLITLESNKHASRLYKTMVYVLHTFL